MRISYNKIKALSGKNTFFKELLDTSNIENGIELSIYESEYRRIIKKNKCPKFSITDTEELEHYFNVFNYFGNDELLEKLYEEIIRKLKIKKRKDNLKMLNNRKRRRGIFPHNYHVNLKFWRRHIKHMDYWVASDELMTNLDIPEYLWEKNSHFLKKCGMNKYLSLSFFEKHLDKIDKNDLIKNPRITEEFFIRNIDKFDAEQLFDSPNISESFMRKYLHNARYITYFHKNMSEEFVEENKHKFSFGFFYTDIPYENFIRRNINEVDWRRVSLNENLSESFFREFIDRVDWLCLSKNKSMSDAFIEEFIDRVDWACLSWTRSKSFIMKHIDKVDWETIYSNPDLDEDFYLQFSHKIQWNNIVNSWPKVFYERLYTENIDKLSSDDLELLLYHIDKLIPESFIDKFLYKFKKDIFFLKHTRQFSLNFYKKNIDYIKQNEYFWCIPDNIPLSFVKKYGTEEDIRSKEFDQVYSMNIYDEKLVSFDEMWKSYYISKN